MDMGEVRAIVSARRNGLCCWPGCYEWGKEVAHLQSRGAGGSKHRDTPENTMWACWKHARHSDGEAAGGMDAYRESHLALLGPGWEEFGASLAFERRVALVKVIEYREEQ